MTPAPTPIDLDSRCILLESVERKLTDALGQIRALRVELGNESRDKGVLGSRGLTKFILEQLEQQPDRYFTVIELLQLAEKVGYKVPTARVISKRLVEHRIRTGLIGVGEQGWFWKGSTK